MTPPAYATITPSIGSLYKIIDGRYYVSGLIRTGNGFREDLLDAAGVRTGTRAGAIRTLQIPLDQVGTVSRMPGISYLQLDEPVMRNLDTTRKLTRVDSVHRGINLPMPYTGAGVIVGVVDVGFDYTHPLFWDTAGSRYRVKRIWEQKATSGTPPQGFAYGAELTDTAAMKLAKTDNAHESHGTHVAGIATGSGWGSTGNNRFRGMAPGSDVVLVGILPAQGQWITTGGTDIIDGINYVFQYAATAGLPAVVNLSWGASCGPHDGTSLFSEALESLCGPGKILVNSAGNSGQTKQHIKKIFSAADTVVRTFPTYDADKKKTWVDVWGDSGKLFRIEAALTHGGVTTATTGFLPMDDSLYRFALPGSTGDTCFFTVNGSPSEFNGRPRGFVTVYNRTGDTAFVSVSAMSGTINMWNSYVESPSGYIEPFESYGKPWATPGDTIQTVGDNATGRSVIAVAAYSNKLAWRTIGNQGYSYPGARRGQIAPFSSTGPAMDGRIKPDIAGPGYGVVSAVNSYDSSFLPGGASYGSEVISKYHDAAANHDYYYAILSGTSMSSPAVAGIVALLLQINPSMTPQQVLQLIQATAIHDNFTGAAANNTWGAGKINAYGAVKRLMQSTGIGGAAANPLACSLYPNPAKSQVTVGYLADVVGQMEFGLYDLGGRRLLTQRWNAEAGYGSREVSLRDVPKGLYLVRIASAKGGTYTAQLLVQ